MPSLLDYFRPQSRPIDPFGPFNSRVTYYAPGPGDRMEGGFETSQPNPGTGQRRPSTLDDVRLGVSPFVTLAADPSRYGQTVKMGPLTYTSPIDQKSYTLPDVTGYVHDTGSAFKGRPDKLDVATGDFRGWSPQQASAFVTADAGRRTVTPLSGDEADQAMRPVGLPEPWRATGEGESPTDQTAIAQGPPQGRKMPTSLLDMFQPTDAAGDPTDIGKALQSRSNSLIGLGLGLMSPAWQGQSVIGNALEGYQRGSAQDATTAARAQALAHQKTQDARQAAMDRFNMGMREKEFTRSGETDFAKYARDQNIAPGTPEYVDAAKKWVLSKQEGDWSIAEVPHPLYPDQKVPVWANKRTRETVPFTPGSAPPGTTGVAGAPDTFTKGMAPVYGTGGDYSASPAAAIPPTASPPTSATPGRAFPMPPPGVNLGEYNKEKTKEYVKQQAEAERTAKQATMIDPVKEDIGRAINMIQQNPNLTTGVGGQMLSHVGGTKASDLSGLLDTIKANISFEKLNQLRQQSPTGGALGNVSDKDMKSLQAVMGNLEQSKTSGQLLYNLDRIERTRHEIIHGAGTAPPPRFAPPEEQRPASARQTAAPSVKPGYIDPDYPDTVFKGGNPRDPNSWATINRSGQ